MTKQLKSLTILDKDYISWIDELSSRYRQSQVKAAVKVNTEMLRFYYDLGKDIVTLKAESKWGSGFMKNLSHDLKLKNPSAACFSLVNLHYMKNFYLLYHSLIDFSSKNDEELVNTLIVQQLAEQLDQADFFQQVAEKIKSDIFSTPWGHHMILIDKFKSEPNKALFFVHQTVDNGWSRDMLLNFIDTDLYERQGKALTNFKRTLPDVNSDLAQEITKDPYNFAFTGITNKYNERKLKDTLLTNIAQFLIELGTGFAYVGKEYRLQIGDTEKFVDLLFYNLSLSCYVVIEVKIGKFDFADLGQLGGYVVSCNRS